VHLDPLITARLGRAAIRGWNLWLGCANFLGTHLSRCLSSLTGFNATLAVFLLQIHPAPTAL
jgi:hypothetical protein